MCGAKRNVDVNLYPRRDAFQLRSHYLHRAKRAANALYIVNPLFWSGREELARLATAISLDIISITLYADAVRSSAADCLRFSLQHASQSSSVAIVPFQWRTYDRNRHILTCKSYRPSVRL